MGSTGSSARHTDVNLAQDFDKLSLDISRRKRITNAPHGKNSDPDGTGNGPAFPTPTLYPERGLLTPPRPPGHPVIAMPIPEPYDSQSRTMRHALAVSQPSSLPIHVGDPRTGLTPSHGPPKWNRPQLDKSVEHGGRKSSPLSPPTRVERVRSAPTSLAPRGDESEEEDDDPDRCRSSTKQAGNPRCRNRRPKHARIPLDEFNTGFKVPFYCGIHIKQQIQRKGMYTERRLEIYKKSGHEDDGYVKFADWIPEYLSQRTRVALIDKMTERSGISEEPGYIYVFEIRNPGEPDIIQFKVGRTTNLLKRLQSWEKQCESNTQVFRYYWPGVGTGKQDLTNFQQGSFKPGLAGPHSHRLERLLHLHLADLVMYAPYNDPMFPMSSPPEAESSLRDGSGSPKGNWASSPSYNQLALHVVQQQRSKCDDCGKTHKEIFPFIRTSQGPYEGQELEKIVVPIIQKWGEFVSRYI